MAKCIETWRKRWCKKIWATDNAHASLIRSAHSYCIDMIISGFYLDFASYQCFSIRQKISFSISQWWSGAWQVLLVEERKEKRRVQTLLYCQRDYPLFFAITTPPKASLCFVCLIKFLVVFSFVVRHSNRDHICVYWFLIYLLRSASHSKPMSLVEFSQCVWIFNGIINIEMKKRWWWW